ncbi:hypothetical protein [Ancylobacter sp. IITR112]|uniref:hypothetical protein n=1 Tax=Ancylobacter sp. IITR112 TaxID=3138073 RepID=UPI00352A761B
MNEGIQGATSIEIEANAGDPHATKPVIYKLDFKRISAKTAFWAGRPAMRVIQALSWFRDEKSNLDTVVNGIARHLERNPNRQMILQDLRENISAIPAWMYPLVASITGALLLADRDGGPTEEQNSEDAHASDVH